MRSFFLLALFSCISSLEIKNDDLHIVVLISLGYRQYASSALSQHSRIDSSAFRERAWSEQNRVLSEAIGTDRIKNVKHRYFELASGFSVPLSSAEVTKLRGHHGVKLVSKSGIMKLLTTRSFDFQGYNSSKGIWRNTTGTSAVIGVIDSGIWPEHPSFSDKGYPAVQPKDRIKCNPGTDKFKCNKKLIGAQFFGEGLAYMYGGDLATIASLLGEYYSPRDRDGHGTHVSSTAAGSIVKSASVSGVPFGSPRGAAYSARLSVYKVFWGELASNADLFLAMDTAVRDGVDVLSLSLGYGPDLPGAANNVMMYYFAYLATLANVPVVFAGGNDGPDWFTTGNGVPWVLTVAASTTDRTYISTAVLGNGIKIEGPSSTTRQGESFVGLGTPLYTKKKPYPLISSETAFKSVRNKPFAELCAPDSLDPLKVKGKIVLCLRGDYPLIYKAAAVVAAGGVGTIIYSQQSRPNDIPVIQFESPALIVTYSKGLLIKNYIARTKTMAKAYILRGKVSYGSFVEAPSVSSFSSAGPNGGSLNILKPDISAPGENIFAAWVNSTYNVISGTSMATPHVSGTIALLKTLHPKWTPSQLFSAIMTTASQTTNRNNLISANGRKATPFNVGAGQINANAAIDPGLVYPISKLGYAPFLCSTDFANDNSNCPFGTTRAVDLNLPSISFFSVVKMAMTARTLQNVGQAGTYTVTIVNPPGATLTVVPAKLVFGTGQSLTYNVIVNATSKSQDVTEAVRTTSTLNYTIQADIYWTFGSILWSDNKGHRVRINVVLNSV